MRIIKLADADDLDKKEEKELEHLMQKLTEFKMVSNAWMLSDEVLVKSMLGMVDEDEHIPSRLESYYEMQHLLEKSLALNITAEESVRLV